MASATKLPSLTDIVYFQWATPSAPSPKLSAPIDATGTTITFTSAPLDESGSVVTEAFLMGIRNDAGYVETIYVPAGALSGDGLTATGVVRGIELTGDDWTTGDANNAAIHQQDSPVFCNITAVIQAIMTNAVQGSIATGGDDFIIGTDAAANTVTIYRSTGVGTTAPWIRWNSGGSEVEYSDDGVAWTAINDVTASNLVVITAADTTPSYLDDKITVSDAGAAVVTKSIVNPGANESINIDVDVPSAVIDVDYTAEEIIEAGAPVSLTGVADEVENFVLSTLSDAGAESTFGATATEYIASTYLADNKVAVIYEDSANDVQVIIGDVAADKSVTWGTPVEATDVGGNINDIVRIDDSTIAILYRDSGSILYARIVTVSGSVPTLGTASAVHTNVPAAIDRAAITLIDTDKLAVAYVDGADANKGKAKAATFTGTTIGTWGTAAEFEAGTTQYVTISKFDTDKAGVFYQDDADADKGKGALLVATGTALAAAAPVDFEAVEVAIGISSDQLDTNKIIIAYEQAGALDECVTIVASLTGLTISYGAAVAVNAANIDPSTSIVAMSTTEAYVGYEERASSDGKFVKLSIAGTVITAGSEQTFNGATNNVAYISLAKVSDKGKFIICYRDEGAANIGNAEVYQEYDNSVAAVGFAQSTVAATDPVVVRSKGTEANQAGLTIGSVYYLVTNGIELTNNSGIKAGVASDTTDLDVDIDGDTGMSKADADTLTDGSNADALHVHTEARTVTVAEAVSAGDVIGYRASVGYVRAWGDNKADRINILGIARESAAFGETCIVDTRIGAATVTAGSQYFLADRGAGGLVINQVTTNDSIAISGGAPKVQTITTTESTIYRIDIQVQDDGVARQVNITLNGDNQTNNTAGTGAAEVLQFNFTAWVPAGTVQSFTIGTTTGGVSILYNNTSLYAGGAFSEGGDIYMKVYEYDGFGEMQTGSNDTYLGYGLSATELMLETQYTVADL